MTQTYKTLQPMLSSKIDADLKAEVKTQLDSIWDQNQTTISAAKVKKAQKEVEKAQAEVVKGIDSIRDNQPLLGKL